MKTIKIMALIGFIILVNSCAVKPPELKKAHLPKIREEVNSIVKQLKSADLNDISINGNLKNIFNYSKEETLEILNGKRISKVQDSLKLLNTAECLELISEITTFKKAHLSTLKYHDYATKYCSEYITLQQWTVKEKFNKDLIEYKEYYWGKREKGIYYYQSYKIITKKGSSEKLEIFSCDLGETLSIKIDGKQVQVLPETSLILKGYNMDTLKDMKIKFFQDIENCN